MKEVEEVTKKTVLRRWEEMQWDKRKGGKMKTEKAKMMMWEIREMEHGKTKTFCVEVLQ